MSGVNRVILLGRLTHDPEIKDANGIQIASFSLATSKEWKDESGEKKQKAEFHSCVAFRKTAELVGKFLKKGRQVFIEGELQTRSWDDKDSGKKRYKTEIVAQNIQFIGEQKAQQTETTDAGFGTSDAMPAIDTNEQIPF